jgi:hypothetical protein
LSPINGLDSACGIQFLQKQLNGKITFICSVLALR